MAADLVIVVVLKDRIIRADADGAGGLELTRLPRSARHTLSGSLEAGLRERPCAGGRLWVLSSEVWTQVVKFPRAATGQLGADELRDMLALEAEQLSGVSSADALLAWRELPSESDSLFWVIQNESSIRDELEQVAKRFGAQLAGLAHPGGLPLSLARTETTQWSRIEFWPDATFVVAASEAGIALKITSALPHLGVPQGEGAHSEILSFDGAYSSDETADLVGQWLARWTEHIKSGQLRVPVIGPAPAEKSAFRTAAVAVLCAALAIVLCAGHFFWIEQQRRRIEPVYNARTEVAEKLKATGRDAATLTKKLDELQKDIARLRGQADALQKVSRENSRLPALLAALAKRTPADVCVQTLECNAREATLRGICLSAEDANELAVALAREMQPLGWTVMPPTKQKSVDQAVWSFTLNIIPDAPAPAAQPAKFAEAR